MKSGLYFIFIGSLLFLASCSPTYYVPNTQNVPLLSHKKQIYATGSGNRNQLELQGAYAVKHHMGVIGNVAVIKPKNDSLGNGGSGKLIEMGLGYFTPIRKVFVFETYGLLGFGTMENHFPSTMPEYPGSSGKIKSTIMRVGIQPNIGYNGKYFMVALSSRLVSLNYYAIKGDFIYQGMDQVKYLNRNYTNFLFEPAFTIRGGSEKLKLQLQVTRSFNLSNFAFQQDFALFTIGLHLHLNSY